MWPAPLWRRLGADSRQLRAILEVKLLMDDRRPGAFLRHRRRREVRKATLITMAFSLILGFFFLSVFLLPAPRLLQLTAFFSLYMFMLAMTLISDFTEVLVDLRDNVIILPKPVSGRTLLISRLLHISIHLCKIIAPLCLPATGWMMLRYGTLAAVLFLVLVLLAALLTLFLVNAVYLLIQVLTRPDRFKEIINYVQILFSIAVFALYYLIPRLSGSTAFLHYDILAHRAFRLAPPLWFAGAWTLLTQPADPATQGLLAWLGALALLMPLLSMVLVVRYLAPSFNRRLGGMAASRPRRAGILPRRDRWRGLARFFTRGVYEQAGFELVWLLSGRSRDFRLKVYPAFAYVVIYMVYFGFAKQGDFAAKWQQLPETRFYVLMIYFSSFAMLTAIAQLRYAERYAVAWIFRVPPLARPGELLAGALKATLVKYFLPFYCLIAAFTLWVWPLRVLADLLLGLINVALFCVLMGFVYLRRMPFSQKPDIHARTGNFMKSLFVMGVPGLVGFLHYCIADRPALVLPCCLLSAALLWLALSKYRRLAWEQLEP